LGINDEKMMIEKYRVELDQHQQLMLNSTMPKILDEVASRWGDQLSIREIEGQQRSVTWAEFHGAVSRLRSGLEAIGVAPGDRVGVLVRNQIEFPVIWFAVAEAGAAIVPLNPRYTSREINFVLEDAGATWLIGLQDLLAPMFVDRKVGPVEAERIIVLGNSSLAGTQDYGNIAASDARPRNYECVPLDITNIQFTSGTTGLPKGCLLTHQYWLQMGAYGAAAWRRPQRALADHPFYYMQNQAYFARALGSGGAIYLTDGLSRRKFMGWLLDHGIDYAWIDEDMLDLPVNNSDKDVVLSFAPVSAIPPSLHLALEARFGLKAREWYASTELGSSIGVPYERDDLTGTGSMGFCLPHRESKIVDAEMNEVAPGEPGELCISGPGIMLGYHNRPEVNSEIFLPGGWFRTGDLVVKTHDGQHFYKGRLKDMVRRSGENISAAEVEQYLGTMPGVLEVGVVPVPDARRGEEVKAIFVIAPGVAIRPDEIIEWARAGLAPFKIPRFLEFRSELPHTGSGKIHKSLLRQEPPLGEGVIDMSENALDSRA